ncbi:SNF2 family helicase Ino80 [Rhodotorula toruloides]|uniref:Chromatin-remodeling ATPase INO80 n=1 Tax=Rhodotorula toruloides TaxID=5286 RepID=A0A511KDF4_RHOTO|nr:SNF2 family helicase Ino80 [Rhodotorula toruloides]
MTSLSRLLDGPEGATSGYAAPPIASSSIQPAPAPMAAPPPKRKRPSRAAAAFIDEEDIANRRSSLRQSTRPARRYNDELYDDGDGFLGRSNGRSSSAAIYTQTGEEVASDEEGDGLLRSTSHIWREPLKTYVYNLHARRRQVEQDVEDDEATRSFLVAARAVEMAEKRIPAMRERRVVRLVELEHETEVRAREEEVARAKAEEEDSKRVKKEQEKEERLRKQREAARRKREEDRLKREHENEQRKVRAEEARIAKLQEAERKAKLTPEEREAEDRALAEKLAREREEAAQRMREMEEELLTSGRGARKRRRPGDDLEADAADALSSFGMYAEYDVFDDEDDSGVFHAPDAKGRKGKGSARRSLSLAVDTPVLPPGAYAGPDGQYYDASGNLLAWPPPRISESPMVGDDDAYECETAKGPGKKKVKLSPEELERKIWVQIARKDIPKVSKVQQQQTTSRQFFSKRLATVVSREARRAATRSKPTKDVQTRAKRVMRELMLYMKGNEKREREARKKAEKEALEKARKEEEVREAKRQARKLNFLITQTELYSHFIGNKIKTSEAEESADTAGEAKAPVAAEPSASLKAAMAARDTEGELRDLNFDEDDEENAALHARRNAQAAVDKARQAASAFDAAAKEAQTAQPVAATSNAAPLDFDGDDLNFQNPETGGERVVVKQPKMLACTLKEYQLKGLNWLANLYEQGINGILADEMGLGKTVQSIALMAYLAEVHNIWGPFLVISPASTLHNWQQEITKFVPNLKALPYWGNTKDRAVLRKFWNRKSIRYDKDAPFHVVVTSYQLAVADEKYFNQVKWQYMVLDEAQAIKSASSARWKTLLGFRCRNRLLLTGTPIQNSMHELWALLHFIMPSLFDSHDEFSEWFSKDIEGSAENKGAMNEHQLRRLHMILKPFMLRRIKKNVQNELGDKIEVDVYCDLTPRQKAMYRTLKENISITDLVARASTLNDDDSVKRLMNLIMQFRKVCNHPELFERADVTAPFALANFNKTASLIRDPDVLEVPYATHSAIEFTLPKMLYRNGGLLPVPSSGSRAGSDSFYLDRLLNIWRPDHVHNSLKENESPFAFAGALDLSPAELYQAVSAHGILRLGLAMKRQVDVESIALALDDADASLRKGLAKLVLPSPAAKVTANASGRQHGLTPLAEIERNFSRSSPLLHPDARFYYDAAVAPAIDISCSDRSFAYENEQQRFDDLFHAAFFGLPPTSRESREAIQQYEDALPGFSPQGVVDLTEPSHLPLPSMQVPQLQKLILDSGKLAKLDVLLTKLKMEGHRCLIYFQMTRMIDLFEEYLAFRQYKYLRLDGSSTISERRDMVTDWQTKPELFIFLLSTRAGGLGINLTAADTVIFYDSDWNPSNDAQAMDRAHRLGQTKQVTVYRLITKDTVDERIVQLARNKKLVQDAVVGSSGATAPSEGPAKANEVVSLLLNDDELEESLRQAEERRKRLEETKRDAGQRGAAKREDNRRQKKAADAEQALKPTGMGMDDDEDGFSFFADVNQTAANDDDAEQPTGSGTETPQPKPKAPRKRKVELDENGQPKAKRKRRTKAEMEIFRAEEAERKRKKEEERLAKKAEKAGKR